MNKILEAYNKESEQIDESTLKTQDYVTINQKELDSRSIVYLTNGVRALYDLVKNMKELKRVLNRSHYNGLSAAVQQDISAGLK